MENWYVVEHDKETSRHTFCVESKVWRFVFELKSQEEAEALCAALNVANRPLNYFNILTVTSFK